MQYVPHDYQAYATEFILSHPEAAILLDMDESAAATSMLVLPPITPAAPETMCCAMSNTAIVMSKVCVTINTAML